MARMGEVVTHLIYLAEPVDLALGNTHAANHVSANLRHAGRYAIYRPSNAWKADGATPDGRLDQVNRAALDRCDAMVAVILKDVQSVGVPMEIEYALARGIPVICLTDHNRSWSLADRPGLTRTEDPEKVVDLVAAALSSPGPTPAQQYRPHGYMLPTVKLPNRIDPDMFADILPLRGYPDDAGLDLFITMDATVPSGAFSLLECGIAVELPPWSWGLIIGRSSAMRDRMLLVTPAVIDAGWRGPLNVGVLNVGPTAHRVRAGDRIGQLIIMYNYTQQVVPIEVDALSEHDRGQNGFGSTGR